LPLRPGHEHELAWLARLPKRMGRRHARFQIMLEQALATQVVDRELDRIGISVRLRHQGLIQARELLRPV
jgi:hypothetical protein